MLMVYSYGISTAVATPKVGCVRRLPVLPRGVCISSLRVGTWCTAAPSLVTVERRPVDPLAMPEGYGRRRPSAKGRDAMGWDTCRTVTQVLKLRPTALRKLLPTVCLLPQPSAERLYGRVLLRGGVLTPLYRTTPSNN